MHKFVIAWFWPKLHPMPNPTCYLAEVFCDPFVYLNSCRHACRCSGPLQGWITSCSRTEVWSIFAYMVHWMWQWPYSATKGQLWICRSLALVCLLPFSFPTRSITNVVLLHVSLALPRWADHHHLAMCMRVLRMEYLYMVLRITCICDVTLQMWAQAKVVIAHSFVWAPHGCWVWTAQCSTWPAL